MAETLAYVTLKRAAQALGVHEQTLRSWEQRGLIRLIRLPGSGYRRVPVEEIERLQEEMTAQTGDERVRIDRPCRDAESLARAKALADTVCAELSDLESETTFDEFIASRRGRGWS
jgi:DNA-binding transcriptional MerR regulator